MSKNINVILKSQIKPIGGPSGYLYNLASSLASNCVNEIKILSTAVSSKVSKRKKKPIEKIIRTIKLKYTPSKIRFNYLINKEKKSYEEFYRGIESELVDSRLNNFHGTTDFYYYKLFHANNKVNTTLMSHTPVLTHLELLEGLQDNKYSKSTTKMLVEHQKNIDIFSFKNAGYIVFPCAEAVSPYDDFIDECKIDRKKIRFILTQSKPMRYKKSRNDFRDLHGISQDATVMAYIGRQNVVKGYDLFCQAVLNLCDDKDIVFLTAGGGVIETPESNNVIDFGWTDDPGSILNASDCLIVPNRETYFDLGIIQALSLNKPIITTFTGGNRWYKDKDIALYFADANADALTECISNFVKSDDDRNKDFFDANFNSDQFAKNYLSFYNSLIEEVA